MRLFCESIHFESLLCCRVLKIQFSVLYKEIYNEILLTVPSGRQLIQLICKWNRKLAPIFWRILSTYVREWFCKPYKNLFVRLFVPNIVFSLHKCTNKVSVLNKYCPIRGNFFSPEKRNDQILKMMKQRLLTRMKIFCYIWWVFMRLNVSYFN